MSRPAPEPSSYGRRYTGGGRYRARAEARQRRFRAEELGAPCGRWGHLLAPEPARAGANFVVSMAHRQARARAAAGKGVAQRTFDNMLSSQAMAFNVFGPLSVDLGLATQVLAPLLPGLACVNRIHLEYTPAKDVFGDQSGRGGVDCDLLIEAGWADGGNGVVVVETKFVEPKFSHCGHRDPGRAKKGKPVCPPDVRVGADRGACGYVAVNGFGYWERADALGTLALSPGPGCPFGGPLWQPWVNHTLAHEEARRRGAGHARFVVCAPALNHALLQHGGVLDDFARVLSQPETVVFWDVDRVIGGIAAHASPAQEPWVRGLRARYAGI